MKLCLVTNYLNKGYINEILIFNQLKTTLNLSPEDVISFHDENKVYNINKQYTHALILLDYNITSYKFILNFLKELNIPKIFIIDSIPEVHKHLNQEFVTSYSKIKDFVFSTLKTSEWLEIYNLADGLVFYNSIDYHEFFKIHNLEKIPSAIIPPSLGKKEDIVFNSNNVIKNKNIGFNGDPSYPNGIFNYGFLYDKMPDYNFSIYGTHGKNHQKSESILNHVVDNCDNVRFYGKLKDTKSFYLRNFLYYDFVIYNSFSFSMYKSLINGVIPIIGRNTSSHLYLKDYPFIAEYMNTDSLYNQIQQIQNTSVSELIPIMSNTVNNIKHLNDKNLKGLYYELAQSISI